MVLSKISRWLLLGSSKASSWSVLLRGLRAKFMILVSVGFDSSPPKLPSSGLLNFLRLVSTFSGLLVYLDSLLVSISNRGAGGGGGGSLGLRATVLKPPGI